MAHKGDCVNPFPVLIGSNVLLLLINASCRKRIQITLMILNGLFSIPFACVAIKQYKLHQMLLKIR